MEVLLNSSKVIVMKLEKVHIILAVWGKEYIELYLKIGLPSQFGEGNLPFLAGRKGFIYKIFTTRKDENFIRNHRAIKKLSKLINTDIIPIDEGSEGGKFELLMDIHNRAIREADRENATIIFLSPDFIMADGTIRKIMKLKCYGYRAIMILTLRLVREEAVPEIINRYYESDNGSISVSPRELVSVAMNYLHPIEKSYYWGPKISSFPIHAYWPVDDEGLIARCFYLHPIMVNPIIKFREPQITIDADYVDLVCPDRSDIYVVRDSDEIACFELSSQSDVDKNAEIRPKFTPTTWNYAKWAVVNANPFYPSTIHHWYFQLPIRIHSSDLSPEWKKHEKASSKSARWIRGFSLCLRKYSNIGEMIYFYYSTKMHNYGRVRLWKNRKEIDLAESRGYLGEGWGEEERNSHGQEWRWIGAKGSARISLILKKGINYVLKTHIHTALGESLNEFKVYVNGWPAIEQHIVRKGDLFWHQCLLPRQSLSFDGGKVEIEFRVDGNRNEAQVALSRIICRPLKWCPGFLYFQNRRRMAEFIRRHFISKQA